MEFLKNLIRENFSSEKTNHCNFFSRSFEANVNMVWQQQRVRIFVSLTDSPSFRNRREQWHKEFPIAFSRRKRARFSSKKPFILLCTTGPRSLNTRVCALWPASFSKRDWILPKERRQRVT